MLEKDSSKRATLEELNMHPFITNCGQLPGPLDGEYHNGIKIANEDSKMLDYEDSPMGESESMNRLELNKKAMHNQIPAANLTNKNDLEAVQANAMEKLPKVWVVKCADYSAKYGMGYLLSNGHVGVFFNDKTKMLLSPKGDKFMYISFDEEGDECSKKYNVKKAPSVLEKRLRLINNFKEYLLENYGDVDFDKGKFSDKVYVKNWLRSRHAFAFLLPNKAAQVLFNDNTEIRVIGKPNKVVSYVSKEGELTTCSLDVALESQDVDFTKRLTYAKKIIKELTHKK